MRCDERNGETKSELRMCQTAFCIYDAHIESDDNVQYFKLKHFRWFVRWLIWIMLKISWQIFQRCFGWFGWAMSFLITFSESYLWKFHFSLNCWWWTAKMQNTADKVYKYMYNVLNVVPFCITITFSLYSDKIETRPVFRTRKNFSAFLSSQNSFRTSSKR